MSKKINHELEDDLQPEYDFSQLQGKTKGKYFQAYQEGTNVILLDPDIAQAFPNQKSVNDALRLLINLAQSQIKT